MPQVLQRALEPPIAPARIVIRHSDDKLPDVPKDTTTARACGVRPFPHNELPMPSQQCVRRDDRGDLAQGRMAHAMRQAGPPPAVVIGEPHATSVELPSQKTVLCDQIRKGRPLEALQPAGQHHQHDLERRGVDHEARGYIMTTVSAFTARRPCPGTERASSRRGVAKVSHAVKWRRRKGPAKTSWCGSSPTITHG